jgi:lipoyl-dependent peroxiredoxin
LRRCFIPVRTAEAVWQGKLRDGQGRLTLGSGAYDGPYSFASRVEQGPGTNPEELIAAAHAGCFPMALSFMLEQAGYTPERIQTAARVFLERVGEGFKITAINLETEARVPGIDEKTFLDKAEAAKNGCPVSQALAGVEVNLQVKLPQ